MENKMNVIIFRTSRERFMYLSRNGLKNRTQWQKEGFDVMPDFYGRPATIVEFRGNRYKVYSKDQVTKI